MVQLVSRLVFLRRFRIWTGKFEILIVAPNMARSVIAVKNQEI